MSDKYLNYSGLGTYDVLIKQVIAGKVDKVANKALSTNDFDNIYKQMLDSLNANLSAKAPIVSPTFTGTPKAPTCAVGTNNTELATTAFTTTAIANAIAGIDNVQFEIVTTLPASGESNIIYLLGASAPYDEYIYINGSWELIGTTEVDLTDYMLNTDMVAITTAEINSLFD